jgi:hypothetical protein
MKPRVILHGPASRHAGKDNRIVEFSFPAVRDSAGCPLGGLIEFWVDAQGTPRVHFYRTDAAVRVTVAKQD